MSARHPKPRGDGAGRQRLFFALWPDDPVRRALADLARESLPRKRGRPVPVENLHLTLVFLGSVDADFRRCAEKAAQGLEAPVFELRFERIGHWPRPRVLWSAPLETPEVLARLVSSLSRSLMACGYRPERRAYSAHLTLARKVQGPVQERSHPPVTWHVDAFHLVASETRADGARYTIVGSWPLV